MLKKIRESKGFSQSQLATACGFSVRTLQCYEQGSRDINGASLSTLVSMALTLECKLSDILSDQELVKNLSKVI